MGPFLSKLQLFLIIYFTSHSVSNWPFFKKQFTDKDNYSTTSVHATIMDSIKVTKSCEIN